MDQKVSVQELAQKVREMLADQAFARHELIQFTSLLLDEVIAEVRAAQPRGASKEAPTDLTT